MTPAFIFYILPTEEVVTGLSKAFERAGWTNEGQSGSHVKPTREGNPNILSIPVHKGKPVKQGLLVNQIRKAGMTVEEFLRMYK